MKRSFLVGLAAAILTVSYGIAAAQDTRVRISRADCQNLVQYRPDPGVAYRPGVDVRGKPVAPADLPGSTAPIALPRNVEFYVSFNPLKGETGRRFDKSELVVGTVGYDLETGDVTFNGQPLTDPEKNEIARRCRHALRR